MDAATFVSSFDGLRPIKWEDTVDGGEMRLSLIEESRVTRMAMKEELAPRVAAFAELNGFGVCRSGDLLTVVLYPQR